MINKLKIKKLLTFGGVLFSLAILPILFHSCATDKATEGGKLNVVCTTTMITDLAKELGKDQITVNGLMGAGVDPHLYKASEGDVTKLVDADLIFYNGLHLEGKLDEVFQKMGRDKKTVALGEVLAKSSLLESDQFASNYDPHIWFNIQNWIHIANKMCEELKANDAENATSYEANLKNYLEKLTVLESSVKASISTLPADKRILVTAHDAFGYFGKAYGFEVVGLQGLSTATEAGVQDVQRLAAFIIDKKVNAIFVESSVPKRTIESLQAAVKSKGHEVKIGGTLYSDALGDTGTVEGTYIGMFEYNVKTLVNSLK